MKRFSASVALLLLLIMEVQGQTTQSISDAETQGRQLARNILDQGPTENSTNVGVLRIRSDRGERSEFPVICFTVVTPTNWQTIYEASWANKTERLAVIHAPDRPNVYFDDTNTPEPLLGNAPVVGNLFRGRTPLSGAEIMRPFAGSDFWISDLGLEFFHWAGQKVLKRETHRSRGCTVLESTNPSPVANGYARVVSWIDNESLGIVEAYAYDAHGKKLKDFYPKDFEKVAGQWQVQTLVMEDVMTGSRSRLEFELKR